MLRTRLSLQHFFIPLVACTAVLLIGSLQWGSGFRTLLGYSQEERTASITLAGITSPVVEIEVLSWEGGASVEFTLEGKNETQEATLSIPALWHLQEVRGVHIREVALSSAEFARTVLRFPTKPSSITLQFRTSTPFDAIAFSHDSDSPALLTLTHVTLPEKEVSKTAKIIEDRGLLTL